MTRRLETMRSRIVLPGSLASEGPGGAVIRRLLPTTVAAVALLGLLRWQGQQLGLYGTKTGILLLTVAVMGGLTGLLWQFARWLDRNDAERLAAEGEARRSGRYFELARDLVCTASFDGRFTDLNAVWAETLGWSEDELRSRSFLEFVHPDDRQQTEQEAAKLGEGGETVDFVNRYQAKDGSWRWLDWSATGIPEEDLIYASARDITDRKEAEDTVRRLAAASEFASKERQVILDSIGEGIMSIDAEGRTTFSNRAAHELTGWSDEDVLGSVQHGLLHHSHADGTPTRGKTARSTRS